MVLVSIITATLNRPSLKDACESVNNQTFKNWHHYVLGDGTLPHDYSHPNRTTLGFSRPIGASQPAMNMPDGTPNPIFDWALKHLDLGDYVCFLDDDNVFLPTFLEKMVNALENNTQVGIALCPVENMRGKWQEIDGYPEYRRCDNSGFIVRSKIAKELGYPHASPEKECVQDYEFIKLCADKYGWVRVPEKLVKFGVSPNPPPRRGGIRIMDSWSLPIKAFQLIKDGKYSEGIEKLESVCKMDAEDAWSLWHLGEVYLIIGDNNKAIRTWNKWRVLVRKLNKWPHNWIHYCYALSSALFEECQEKKKHIKIALTDLKNYNPKERILEIDKYLNLGLYSLLNNNIKDALLYYTQAIEKGPDDVLLEDALWNLKILNIVCKNKKYKNISSVITDIIKLLRKKKTEVTQ